MFKKTIKKSNLKEVLEKNKQSGSEDSSDDAQDLEPSIRKQQKVHGSAFSVIFSYFIFFFAQIFLLSNADFLDAKNL
jgi:hypothetical protein